VAWSWIALGLFFLGVNTAEALLTLGDSSLAGGATFMLRFVSLFLFWQWLESECRPYRQTYPLDMGMFLYAAGVGLIPYYMWRTQRWRGVLKVAGLAGLWVATYLIAEGGAFVLGTFTAE
jgi:hypothetical protein